MERVLLNLSKAEAYAVMEALRLRTDMIITMIQAQLNRREQPPVAQTEEKKPAVRAKLTKRRVGRPRKNASPV